MPISNQECGYMYIHGHIHAASCISQHGLGRSLDGDDHLQRKARPRQARAGARGTELLTFAFLLT